MPGDRRRPGIVQSVCQWGASYLRTGNKVAFGAKVSFVLGPDSKVCARTRQVTMSIEDHCSPELRLFQITDSAFPFGSFAFSYGLESMAKLGLIKDISDFKKYLLNVLTQVSCSEIPFVNSSYKCAPGEHDILVSVFGRLEAFITIPCMRKASITQGRSLLQAVKAVYPEYNFQKVTNSAARHGLFTHYAPVFGMVSPKLSV